MFALAARGLWAHSSQEPSVQFSSVQFSRSVVSGSLQPHESQHASLLVHKPVRHDLNQIPYNYTVEGRNRFKGLDLIHRVLEELWMEVPDIGF